MNKFYYQYSIHGVVLSLIVKVLKEKSYMQ
ncbi:hypothetical protein BDD43_1126 [Mucilaginibacter gracilis]|uniref:Uncharacterized protein n=1 Tax=Mucilaginibacter gracilis TaxID=423350 RepID=A0A495IW56_9SPHI|nr:hypothetical protein BDD43_1126 [Mucilaginibacter gracilis]